MIQLCGPRPTIFYISLHQLLQLINLENSMKIYRKLAKGTSYMKLQQINYNAYDTFQYFTDVKVRVTSVFFSRLILLNILGFQKIPLLSYLKVVLIILLYIQYYPVTSASTSSFTYLDTRYIHYQSMGGGVVHPGTWYSWSLGPLI